MIDIDALLDGPALFVTTLPSGERFTWRLLTLKEHRIFSNLAAAGVYDQRGLGDAIFERCYQGNVEYINGNVMAGITISIGLLIFQLSGPASAAQDRAEIAQARAVYPANSVIEHMKKIVFTAFPSYTPEDADRWTRPDLLLKFAMAEAVLVARGNFEPLDLKKILAPGEQPKKTHPSGIDFAKENKELNKEYGDGVHILDQPIENLHNKMKKREKLTPEQLKGLDRKAALKSREQSKK